MLTWRYWRGSQMHLREGKAEQLSAVALSAMALAASLPARFKLKIFTHTIHTNNFIARKAMKFTTH